ncbi:hypothetical protein KY284_010978 [Solanum tuberosum]|nr:hypothetical protein KY284_010978 [Solanum tuberosum]
MGYRSKLGWFLTGLGVAGCLPEMAQLFEVVVDCASFELAGCFVGAWGSLIAH